METSVRILTIQELCAMSTPALCYLSDKTEQYLKTISSAYQKVTQRVEQISYLRNNEYWHTVSELKQLSGQLEMLSANRLNISKEMRERTTFPTDHIAKKSHLSAQTPRLKAYFFAD
ncbi:hypothetical protein [Vibrio panuliri]|uniref:Uncharacterized protein n=1 Tax=Vibrio panuliri TaxID=1381081 RepID=A0ABX3F9A3_9VIBR|nr:hypothetical protein [Vibrio panuliri]KAB1457751.1 hypothetical protein F7O85_08430 [Vibrio panuliri]OLQ85765.1 hypothetical protein BIY20_02950 [Vibrio panuliri]